MNRTYARLIALLAVLLIVVTAAYAGNWATITVRDFPDYAVAGKNLILTFEVRQHGRTLLSGLRPTVRARSAAGLETPVVTVQPGTEGEYTTLLVLPQPDDWTITINSGFSSSSVTLPALKVISADSLLPVPFALTTRGARLFTAKGCVGCHRHAEINPERASDASFDLTNKRLPPDYLKKFLADPGIKPAEMPSLNLRQDEIEALAAFINKSAQKSLPVRTNP
jgi:Cytochrome C oxidase, cbb3-type, subunit III